MQGDSETVVSVVLPAYNEEATIELTIKETINTLDSFLETDEYEVIVAEDGCDDRTPEIVERFAEKNDCVRHFHSRERLGRGGALTASFRQANGDVLVYFDTDLATDMDHLEQLVESIRSEGYDVATGSRWLPDSDASRPVDRKGASWFYNRLVRLFLRSELRDHQCGFKAFRKDALLELLASVKNEYWFWDTEVLVRAQLRGYDVKEFSVEWTPKGDTKVDLLSDAHQMGREILRLWWELSVESRVPIKKESLNPL